MHHILAVPGSLRQGSYNRKLLAAAAREAPAGTEIELYDGLAGVPFFDEDLERDTGGGPEPVRRLRADVAAADGLLIATPEYNQSMPGVLKNAIDWLSRGPTEVLTGKPIAVVGVSTGRWGTRLAQTALRQVLYATGALVLPQPALFLRDAERLFDDAGRLVDQPSADQLRALLAAFDAWIERVAPAYGCALAPV